MFTTRTLGSRLERLPMVRALVPYAAGIALAEHYALPSGLVWAGFAVCGALALVRLSPLYMAASLLLFGWGMAMVRATPQEALPRNVRTAFAITVEADGTGRITAWRDLSRPRWHAARSRIVLRTDSTLVLRRGDRVVAQGYLRDLPPTQYGALMRHRGMVGSVWLTERRLIERHTADRRGLHEAAVERIGRLGLAPEAEALCQAMAAGARRNVPPELRAAYARSGTAHLLAVSGLHVGIVFALANLLLRWMPLLRRGHLVRNVAAVALVWLYAATTGLSPSVVRAALMFTALQGALASSSTYNSGNTLAATAFAMLVWQPALLFDIGFRLSFVAVAAILAWALPLTRRLRTGWRAVDLLVATLVVGLTASVATAPLTAEAFGQLALAGFAVNPAVIPLATAILFVSVVWMVAPLPFAAPLVRWLLDTAAGVQNAVVTHAAALPWAAVEWRPSPGCVAAIYALFVAITLVAACMEPKKNVTLHR